MYIDQMDLSSYPIKAHSSSEGIRYLEGPRPATNNWRINYENVNGFTKWVIWSAEKGSACAELPLNEILILEKRMEKPAKILQVQFGALYKQKEPNGEWVCDNPNDPRVALWIEGDYTRLYVEDWRVRAYDGKYDPFKLIRGYTADKLDKAKINNQENVISELTQKNIELTTKCTNLLAEISELRGKRQLYPKKV